MSAVKGTRVTAKIVPNDTADTYPTHDSTYGLGGWREVADTTARDAIPTARLRQGTIVYVQADGKAYLWNGSTYLPYLLPQYPLFWFFPGVPGNSQYTACLAMVAGCKLPASLTGSQFKIRVNPTSTTVFSLFKNGSAIGSISFNTSGVASVTFASDVTFAAGDVLQVQNQVTADATAADISFSFVATLA